MSEQRIAEIEARLKAATPGPWEHRDGSNYKREDHAGSIWGEGVAGYWLAKIEDDGPRPEADAAFIAHAPSDIAYLLAALREARKDSTRIEAIANLLVRAADKELYSTVEIRFDVEPPDGGSVSVGFGASKQESGNDALSALRRACDKLAAAYARIALREDLAGAGSLDRGKAP